MKMEHECVQVEFVTINLSPVQLLTRRIPNSSVLLKMWIHHAKYVNSVCLHICQVKYILKCFISVYNVVSKIWVQVNTIRKDNSKDPSYIHTIRVILIHIFSMTWRYVMLWSSTCNLSLSDTDQEATEA